VFTRRQRTAGSEQHGWLLGGPRSSGAVWGSETMVWRQGRGRAKPNAGVSLCFAPAGKGGMKTGRRWWTHRIIADRTMGGLSRRDYPSRPTHARRIPTYVSMTWWALLLSPTMPARFAAHLTYALTTQPATLPFVRRARPTRAGRRRSADDPHLAQPRPQTSGMAAAQRGG